MPKKLAGYLNFFWAGVAKGTQTGAIVPSQKYLVTKMIAPIPASYSGLVVELGAGTGALTLRLAKKCPNAKIIACEINPTLAKDLRKNLDAAGINGQVKVVRDSAEHVLSEIASRNGTRPRYIVSGIPLGYVRKPKAVALIEAIAKALGRDGMYIQFQYSLIDRKNIQATFPDLKTRPVVLNFPPAFVYYARKR